MLACKTSNMWIGQKHFAEKGFDLYKRNLNAHLGAQDMHLLGIHFFHLYHGFADCLLHPKQIYVGSFFELFHVQILIMCRALVQI